MPRFPILLNYDPRQCIGWVEISVDGLANDALLNSAIVPGAYKKQKDDEFEVDHFGFIPRSAVDTNDLDPKTGQPR